MISSIHKFNCGNSYCNQSVALWWLRLAAPVGWGRGGEAGMTQCGGGSPRLGFCLRPNPVSNQKECDRPSERTDNWREIRVGTDYWWPGLDL